MRPPAIESPAHLAQLRRELPPWRACLDEVASRHRIVGNPVAATSGTQPVFLYPNAVVKLYAPTRLWHSGGTTPSDAVVERTSLEQLGAAGCTVPRIFGDGAFGDWAYLAMTRVHGQPIEAVLPRLPADAQRHAMRRLGEAVAAAHAVEPREVVPAVRDFDAFLTSQVTNIVATERRRGAPDVWLDQLEEFVAGTPRGDASPVMLHTELGPGHSLFRGATLTGIIDWAETLIGDAEYDLAAVAFFVARGDGTLLGEFLNGYGWSDVRGAALAHRLLRYLLLHRYAPLSWLLEQRPVRGVRRLSDLAVPWMGAP